MWDISDISLREFERHILQPTRTSLSVELRVYDFFLPILGAIIIILNLMIVFSSGLILRKRQQPRSTYIFLGNVALADMLIGVTTIVGKYYPRKSRTEMVCCVSVGLIVTSTLVSIYSIGLIAVDRYLYIMFGLQYQRFLSSKRARCLVLGTWALGSFIGFLPAMGLRNPTENGRICWLIVLEPTGLILSTVAVGVIPLVAIIVLYCIILKKALEKISEMRRSEAAPKLSENNDSTELRYFRGGTKKIKPTGAVSKTGKSVTGKGLTDIQQQPTSELSPSNRSIFRCCRKKQSANISEIYCPSRWKAIKIVVFTTGCFFVTWFPYFFACGLYALCDPNQTPLYCEDLRVAIASPLAILGLLNSLLNPIIYAWWHNGFRKSAKRIFFGFWNKKVKSKFIAECNTRSSGNPYLRNISLIDVNEETFRVSFTTSSYNSKNGDMS